MIVQSLQPDDNDYIVRKPRHSRFFGNSLAASFRSFPSCPYSRSAVSLPDLLFKTREDRLEKGVFNQVDDRLPGADLWIIYRA